jgi:hypothetical protein
MKIILVLSLLLMGCSERVPDTYRVFTMNSSGDYLQTIAVTQNVGEASNAFNNLYRQREECSENCDTTFQQLYIAVEPCRSEYGLTVCKSIRAMKKW